VSDAKQLDKVKRQIEMVPGVIKVERIKQLPAQKETHAEE
jgi:hypothetical protein